MKELEIKALLLQKINEVKELGRLIGCPNILYNEQYKELELAMVLGHLYNEGQGEDASINNENCEYKTMVGESGSFQYHWISKEKLEKLKNTPHHYFGIYNKETSKLDRIYYLPLEKIINEIEAEYTKAEKNLALLNESGAKKKSKNTDAHKSFSLSKIKNLGAKLVHGIEPENVKVKKVKAVRKK